MAIKRAIPNKDGVYFITFTCAGWLNLIDTTNSYDVIYKWFDYLKQAGHFIIGYQLMPNHVHCRDCLSEYNKAHKCHYW